MKVAFIHGDKKVKTGANYINNLIADKLKVKGVKVRDFYPTVKLFDPPFHLKGLSNILFFYSLLEHRYDILKYDIIHGTTYTPLPFLTYKIPVVSHFGSTTYGMLVNTPLAINLCKETKSIWYQLKKDNVINELNIRTRKPQRDIIDIEHYVALRATAIIATSKKVHDELVNQGVTSEKITIIHNAIEDYWFKEPPIKQIEEPKIVYIGRLGSDAFTYKLKGLDRLIYIYNAFPNSHKIMISITSNSKLAEWLKLNINNLTLFSNLNKNKIPIILIGSKGDIALCNEIKNNSSNSNNIINLAGKTSLRELAAIMKLSSLVIGVDSGPIHIASSQNAKIIDLINKRFARCWYPWMPKERYVLLSSKNSSLDSISLEEIESAAEKLLK